MIVELISTGSEVLLGDILNSNARFLARECAALGFDIYHQTVVGDNFKRLQEALLTAAARSDIVITTGGLGTTGDDLTLEVINKMLGKEILSDGYMSYPAEAKLLPNHNGLAKGVCVKYQDCLLIALPGPPQETELMFEKELRPLLETYQDAVIQSLEVKIGLMGEYKAYSMLSDIIEASVNPSYATYAKNEGVSLRITAKARNQKEAEKLLHEALAEVKKVYKEKIISIDGKPKAETLIDLLKARGETVAAAESITGGLIAASITEIPGASEVLKESYVVYSDAAKMKILAVDPAILEKYGAVSKACAEAMLKGLFAETKADLCIAATGYAGPGGDVGKIFIGVKYHDELIVKELNIKRDRSRNRNTTKNYAIDLAIIEMRKYGNV